MPAPFPDLTGDIRPTADRIVLEYQWIAQWSDEIGTDADLTMKKLSQLVFHHCRLFNIFAGRISNPAFAIVTRRAFARQGVEWSTPAAMLVDLASTVPRA